MAALAAGASGILSAAALAGTPATTVFLRSNEGPDISQAACRAAHGCGPTVKASVLLSAHQSYTIRVTGTISVWNFWAAAHCGTPEPRPEYPTAGEITPTGDDAVFRFAIHMRDPSGRCDPVPFRSGLFQMNLGSGWFSPSALGNPRTPSRDHGDDQHPYAFRVIGQGVAPRFRFVDYHPSDNHGKFKIVISAEP
jgi:hypothetical protein